MHQLQFSLRHYASAEGKPELQLFEADEFFKAREAYQRLRHRIFKQARTGDPVSGFVPFVELWITELDEKLELQDEKKMASTRHELRQFPIGDPVTESLVREYEGGMRWFAQDEDGDRSFFESETEALAHANSVSEARLRLYNLDRHLDKLEERNLRYFLRNRPAISTNQVEALCGVARGTLSKVKNGQRRMNRPQYHRFMEILPDYGYEPHIDLRLLEQEANLENSPAMEME